MSDAGALFERVGIADCFSSRAVGLLGQRVFPSDLDALLITRCASVHTILMRFAIDVVFLNTQGRVLRVARELPPCSFARCPGACAVIEVAAGVCRHGLVNIGDRLVPVLIEPDSGAIGALATVNSTSMVCHNTGRNVQTTETGDRNHHGTWQKDSDIFQR